MDGLLVLLEIGLHRVTGGTELHLVCVSEEGIDTTQGKDTDEKNTANNADFFPRQLFRHDLTFLPDSLSTFLALCLGALIDSAEDLLNIFLPNEQKHGTCHYYNHK